ncbi:hypothetical protein [Motilibacter aurantiacus]|uniref:hypothetical protein n=1 Tax=Motilibacter aurantiacus TaxID=2714955 RepID=UPI001408D372|nr:hypothetical protein [Motilibacter aurantiacus]NHC45333.1 hypothetical protein [Motilibacter aurantiacus]
MMIQPGSAGVSGELGVRGHLAAACRLTGVSEEPGRGVEPDVGLYDFWTARGAHVSLHNADCTDIAYSPGLSPTVTARFLFTPFVATALAESYGLEELLS